MRALLIFAILGSALIGFATAPADARNISGGAFRSHPRIVTSRPFVSRPFGAGRFVTGSLRNFGSQRFVLDRFSGRLVAFDRRGFARSRRFTPFGLDRFDRFGGIGGIVTTIRPEAAKVAERVDHAANVALCHCLIASALKFRKVDRETRWR